MHFPDDPPHTPEIREMLVGYAMKAWRKGVPEEICGSSFQVWLDYLDEKGIKQFNNWLKDTGKNT